MTGMLAIYVPHEIIAYGGTFDSADAHLVRVMGVLDKLGVVRLGTLPIKPKKGHVVGYTVTPWGRKLHWLKDTRRGYWVRLPVEDY